MSRGWYQTCFADSKRGFLLIELMIGLSIFTMAVLAASGYMYHLVKTHAEGKNRMRAISIARSAMAQLVLGNPHSISLQDDGFKIEWHLVPDPKIQFSRAQVRVSWTEQSGALRSVVLDSGACNDHV